MNVPSEPMARNGGIEGVVWILNPTSDFDATVTFFDAFRGLVLEEMGTPVQDMQFSRYAVFRTENGVVLEVVEPTLEKAELFIHPVVSISVRNLRESMRGLTEQGVNFITEVIGTEGGECWTYFRSPCGTLYQLSADSSAEELEPVVNGSPGIERIVVPCRSLTETVHFFEKTLGLTVQRDAATNESSHFSRSARVLMTNGVVLEFVEPMPSSAHIYGGPVVVLTVNDLASEIAQLEERGVPLELDKDSAVGEQGWCYLQVPGGTTFEFRGPLTGRAIR